MQPTLILIDDAAETGADTFYPGGDGHIMVEATAWNGATVKLQAKTPNGTYLDVGSDTSFTANGQAGFELGECTIRAAVSGGPPTGVRVYVKRIPGKL